ncbi:MAG TPA: TlpA disulfide reductase family protein, partial [Myxococcaceae bacterium]|nr:TlpA disulfide reductase family protein [Myxococcaceae bacterium]
MATDAGDAETAPPRKGGGRWGLALFSAALAVAMVVQLTAETRRSQLLERGSAAPPFSAARHGGGALSSDVLRGRVVMLDFWATWCPPCVEEMPSLLKLAREYEGRGLTLVAANRDDP